MKNKTYFQLLGFIAAITVAIVILYNVSHPDLPRKQATCIKAVLYSLTLASEETGYGAKNTFRETTQADRDWAEKVCKNEHN